MVGMDRISELPQPVLHHILSFLPMKQIAQTAVLSKTWNRAWCTYPVLEFDRTILDSKLYYYSGDMQLTTEEKLKELQRRRKKLFNCFEQALRNRHCREMISMKKFKADVLLFEDPMFASFMERCIFHAIGSNVKELSLEFQCGRYRWYSLPETVLFAESVELLSLKGCRFELLGNNVRLSSLRKLYLSHVSVNDHVIESLVSGCPMIEDINLSVCDGLKNLKLFGLRRLNDVKVTNNNELERLNIEAPNILSMDIFWLSPSCVINVNPYMNIKQLGLRSVYIKDDWLRNLIRRLPFLEDLRIWDCFHLRNIEISSHCLKKLLFNGCREVVELKIDTPNLQCFAYSGDIISMSLNALALSELFVELPWRHFDPQLFVNYIELLAKFRCCSQVINLLSTMEKNVIIPRKLRQELPSPLFSVKHLNVKLVSTPFPSEISEVLDGLLWISPHTKTISIEYGCNSSCFKFQFSYKKQLTYEGKFASCCDTTPLLCWQHCIEEVNVEISDICEIGKNMKSYTLNGANILEKIDTFCRDAGSSDLLDIQCCWNRRSPICL